MLGGKGCSRPNAKWKVKGVWVKWKWISWKWKAGGGGSEIQTELTWWKQWMRWWILGRELDQSTSRASAIVWFHDSQSHLYHRRKKEDFLNFRADRKVLGHDVSRHLSEVIHPYFICVVSSPTVTCKSAAEYLCCIYVMALAQARKISDL